MDKRRGRRKRQLQGLRTGNMTKTEKKKTKQKNKQKNHPSSPPPPPPPSPQLEEKKKYPGQTKKIYFLPRTLQTLMHPITLPYPFPPLPLCLPLFLVSAVVLPYWLIHLHFPKPSATSALTRSRIVTTCTLANWPPTQKSNQQCDPINLAEERRRRRGRR